MTVGSAHLRITQPCRIRSETPVPRSHHPRAARSLQWLDHCNGSPVRCPGADRHHSDLQQGARRRAIPGYFLGGPSWTRNEMPDANAHLWLALFARNICRPSLRLRGRMSLRRVASPRRIRIELRPVLFAGIALGPAPGRIARRNNLTLAKQGRLQVRTSAWLLHTAWLLDAACVTVNLPQAFWLRR